MSYNEFLRGYVDCLFWTAVPVDDEHDIEPSHHDLDPSERESVTSDCEVFWEENEEHIAHDPGGAGHDFCLTRNGHGAGFWDGDWVGCGDLLTERSEVYGSQYLIAYGNPDEPQFTLCS